MSETTIYWLPEIARRLGAGLVAGLVQPTLIASGDKLLLEESATVKVIGGRPDMPARLEVSDRRAFGSALVALQPFYLVPEDDGEDGSGPDYRVEVDAPGGRVTVGCGYGPILSSAAAPAAEVFRLPGVYRGVDLGAGQVTLFVDRGEAYVQVGERKLPVRLAEAPTWARLSAASLAGACAARFLEDGSVVCGCGRVVGVWAGNRHVLPV